MIFQFLAFFYNIKGCNFIFSGYKEFVTHYLKKSNINLQVALIFLLSLHLFWY